MCHTDLGTILFVGCLSDPYGPRWFHGYREESGDGDGHQPDACIGASQFCSRLRSVELGIGASRDLGMPPLLTLLSVPLRMPPMGSR